MLFTLISLGFLAPGLENFRFCYGKTLVDAKSGAGR